MKKYGVFIKSALVFLVVFILSYYLFNKVKFPYIVKLIITFISIFIAIYFTKEKNRENE